MKPLVTVVQRTLSGVKRASILLGMSVALLCAAVDGDFRLTDPFFSPEMSLEVELLESGELRSIKWGESFSMVLPFDTLWNLCVRPLDSAAVLQEDSSATGLSEEVSERCYEITAHVSDSSRFSALLEPERLSPHFVLSQSLESLFSSSVVEETLADPMAPERQEGAEELELQSESVVERSTRLQKVQVRVKKRPQRALGQSVVSAKSIKRMPGLGEADVVKAIQSLPGVVASSDFSSKIYVRGGSSDQNLFLFDNGVVFSPVHFFGLFSTFLVEGVDKVEFYKGGFPPRYGNRLSSVVDVQSRVGGDPDSLEWFHKSSLKVSAFSTQGHTEGHRGDFSWIFAGRVTYIKETLAALRAAGLIDLDLDYRFYDLQGNLTWSPEANRSAMFSWYTGQDVLNFGPFVISWGNTVLPLNLRWSLDDETELKMTYAYSLFHQSFVMEGLMNMSNDNYTQTFKPSLARSLNERLLLEFGLEVQNIYADFSMEQEAASLEVQDGGELWLWSPFLQARWSPERWEITAGVRGNLSTSSDLPTVEPRFSVRRWIGDNHQIDFHIGLYYQYLNSIMLVDMENLNEFYFPSKKTERGEIPPSNSLLFSLGYTRSNLPFGFEGIAEVYFKTLNDLLVFDVASAPDSVQQNLESKFVDFIEPGEGYSYGAELSLRRNEGILFGGVSYSWGEAILKDFEEAIFANWDRTHSLKADLSINWKGEDGIWKYKKNPNSKRYFRSSTQVSWSSGVPYTEIIGYTPNHQIDRRETEPFEIIQGARNSSRYPFYFRWDIKPIDIGVEGRWSFSWTILNVTDHKNIFLYSYDQSKTPPERQEIPQFPFFPIFVSYELYF